MARQKTRDWSQVVEGALLGAALTVVNGLLIEQSVLDINRKPTGNTRDQTAGPVDIFKTRDGWIPRPGCRRSPFSAMGPSSWGRTIG